MWPFGKNSTHLQIRPVTAADRDDAARLLQQALRRYDLFFPDSATTALSDGHGVVAERDGRLVGLILCSRPQAGSSWLRAAALAAGELPRQLLPPLLRELDAVAAALECRLILYGADEEADGWMLPALRSAGYEHDTDVVVYAKHDGLIPSWGNQLVVLRRAERGDLPALQQLDQRCFTAQWQKDRQNLEFALRDGTVMLAELDETVVGYTYVSQHYAGRLAHLVRIAVDPTMRGQAVAVRLMAAFVTAARAAGADTLTLNTQAFNHQAQRLYQWFGFSATGEHQVVMRRLLPVNGR